LICNGFFYQAVNFFLVADRILERKVFLPVWQTACWNRSGKVNAGVAEVSLRKEQAVNKMILHIV
jgi:hypothetical protein